MPEVSVVLLAFKRIPPHQKSSKPRRCIKWDHVEFFRDIKGGR